MTRADRISSRITAIGATIACRVLAAAAKLPIYAAVTAAACLIVGAAGRQSCQPPTTVQASKPVSVLP